MSRCVLCDKSAQGLSDYHPMGRIHGTKFTMIDGDMYCEECSTEIDETLNEMYESDLDEEAFEYDD